MGLQKTHSGRFWADVEALLMERNGQVWDLCEVKTNMSWLWIKYGGGVDNGIKKHPETWFLATKWTVVSLTNTEHPGREAGWDMKTMTMSLILDF